jgi:hypothetical protein
LDCWLAWLRGVDQLDVGEVDVVVWLETFSTVSSAAGARVLPRSTLRGARYPSSARRGTSLDGV